MALAETSDRDGKRFDERTLKTLQQCRERYPKLNQEIESRTRKVLQNMGIKEDDMTVALIYVAPSGVKATIVTD